MCITLTVSFYYTLQFSIFLMEQAHKKLRVGEVEQEKHVDQSISSEPSDLRANDLITLQFIDGFQKQSEEYFPEYTHQVFDNENINFIHSDPNSAKICISVDCSILSHKVDFASSLTAAEVSQLRSALQKIVPDDTDNCLLLGLSQPPGRLIYSCQCSSSQIAWELWLATAKDVGASELLARAEYLSMWFIETADSVDFNDDRWEVIFMVRVFNDGPPRSSSPPSSAPDAPSQSPPSVRRSFMGYTTLFSFRNPFLGTKLRVCQALILPLYQGKGFGRELLLSVHKLVVRPRDDVSELTVEDPAPAFQRLRDSVELELFWEKFSSLFSWKPQLVADTDSVYHCAGNKDAFWWSAVVSWLNAFSFFLFCSIVLRSWFVGYF
jgi:hypothetical protein